MDFEQENSSSWDGRQKYIEELATIRKGLHNARINKNVNLRYDLLLCYFMTLIARIKRINKKSKSDAYTPEYTAQIDFYNEVAKLMAEHDQAHTKNRKYDDMPKLLTILNSWELSLRQQENDLGLLMPDSDDPGLAILK